MVPPQDERFTVKYLTGFAVFTVFFALYTHTMCPTISTGDSGEFIAAAKIMGTAHSPGYPAFLVVSKVMDSIMPVGTTAYRVNLVSAVLSALSVLLLFLVLTDILGVGTSDSAQSDGVGVWSSIGISAIAAAVLGLSLEFWKSAVQTEVFAMNTLFMLVILYLMYYRHPEKSVDLRLYAITFIFGLAMGNHQTIALIIPGVAAWYFMLKKKVNLRVLFIAIIFALCGMTVYLYLMIRSVKNPVLDWGNAENIYNLWRVFTRADYGSFSLTVGEKVPHDISVLIRQIVRYAVNTGEQLTWVVMAVAITAWVVAYTKNRVVVVSTVLLTLFSGIFFFILGNPPFNAMLDGVLGRFYILSSVGVCISFALGLAWIYRKVKHMVWLAAVIPVFLFTQNYNSCDWREYYLTYDYGKNVLKTMALKSVLFMDGGDDTFYSLAYLNFAEKQRGDVELHDRGGLVFSNAYGSDFRSIPRDEKERRRIEVEAGYAKLKPVYYSTFNPNILPGYKLTLCGILYLVESSVSREKINSHNFDYFELYSLRGVYDKKYYDYRSRSLVPLYFYQAGVSRSDYTFWDYAWSKYPDAMWLESNIYGAYLVDAYEKFQQRNYPGAEALYRRALRIKPNDISTLCNLAAVKEHAGELESAKTVLTQALRINPRSTEAYYNLGVIYWREQNWSEAVNAYRRIVEIEPDNQRAYGYMKKAEENLKRRSGQ